MKAFLRIITNHGNDADELIEIPPRKKLDLELRIKEWLKDTHSDYKVRNVTFQTPSMGGANYAAILTSDHIGENPTIEDADKSVAVWESGDFWFDIEEP